MDVGDEELTNRDIPISLEICLERNGNAMVKMISKLRHWAGVECWNPPISKGCIIIIIIDYYDTFQIR